ncbi:MAG: Nif3-like dinuclear metal center hexameric protein [Magnetococcales bacterium]|nr:Nif3-like dinuclear metal center hexameric protein [Magnetococcales bacterium]NGZ26084.1 Nif3-like dinuclear metal center hexameric protein [Magnetococcales bacterium]
MALLSDIEHHLNQVLDKDAIADYTPNGVQVRGCPQVDRVVTGVSASLALFQAAVSQQAQLVIAHHGLIWDKEVKIVEGSYKQRLKLLLDHDISLLSYHLPLDRHPQLGNNAQILHRLGLATGEPFGKYRGIYLSRLGHWSPGKEIQEVVTLVNKVFGGLTHLLPFGSQTIQTVAICSGGAPELIFEALQAKADLFLVGEASEPLYHIAREEKINVIAAGHHRTERFGVMALGELLETTFGVQHHFVDSDNPV